MVHLSQSLAVSNLMYIVRNMQQWNAESRVNLLITLKECNGMSEHCPFMISNSKQEKHHINNNLQLFHKGGLGSYNFSVLDYYTITLLQNGCKLKSKHKRLEIRYP